MKIDITILGLLMEENLYGYEIKKRIVDRLEDYVDIKFGSIYYAIKKALESGWIVKAGSEKASGNPERYIYEILPSGKKQFRKLLKQYFDSTLIHFDIDFVLLFFNSLTEDQKQQFIEDRLALLKEKTESLKKKMEDEKKVPEEKSNMKIYSYIDHHLKAEVSWLKSLTK